MNAFSSNPLTTFSRTHRRSRSSRFRSASCKRTRRLGVGAPLLPFHPRARGVSQGRPFLAVWVLFVAVGSVERGRA